MRVRCKRERISERCRELEIVIEGTNQEIVRDSKRAKDIRLKRVKERKWN